MTTIKHRIDVKVHALEAFDLAQNFVGSKSFAPFEKWSGEGTGTKLPLHLRPLQRYKIKCEELRFDRPRCLKVKMVKGPAFLKGFICSWRFIYIDADQTAVVFTYEVELEPKSGWMQKMVEDYFQWDMEQRLRTFQKELDEEVDLLEGVEEFLQGVA